MEKNPKLIRLLVIIGVAVILVIAFSSSLFFTIGPGERGVMYKPLKDGLDKEFVYDQGLHVKAPWNSIIVFEVRKKENEQAMEVLSSNGLDISLDISIRYRPEVEKIGYLYNEVGADYLDKIVVPEVRSATREVIGNYKPEELYSSDRREIQKQIYTRTDSALNANHIDLDALLIRSIKLPPQIKAAIERKLTEQQEIQQKEYSKQKAQKEAERREIEATGKAKANEILNASLSDKVLRDKAIEATERLANSKNSKVVVIGNSENSLPVLLSGDK
ncbi:MAG: prohibitin family protein [Salibacter sp.]|uniref:prohibitin family protein n=1 Tax=Salibacter sp. TaxID=2010995 RepID=UPI0028702233|nr:prohibitin family protein [Salibacter sp.]MDR9399211.1 prohibitin family protein [Salibacter sp.]